MTHACFVCAVKVQYVCFGSGSPAGSTEGSNRRLLVYQHCVLLCESGDLRAEVAADVVGLLMLEVTIPLHSFIDTNFFLQVMSKVQ